MASAEAGVSVVEGTEASEAVGGRVELRYVARAGLLPELSRQTYDSLYKALREAVLNSFDACATRVDLDFSRVGDDRRLIVTDDGEGMTTRGFCDHFMSVGGSARFGDDGRFGRIGIGSLALLQYAESAMIETKRAGSTYFTRACVEHPWLLRRDERRSHLGDLSAGHATEHEHEGSADDHFTRLMLDGVNESVVAVGLDAARFYALLDSLRRVLPLPWSDSPVMGCLGERSPELIEVLQAHVAEWAAPVYVHSAWERDIELRRRSYGEDKAGGETWSGPPAPILKRVRIDDGGRSRSAIVAGFLISQERAQPAWAGLTARVQNVAVEENTFFDVTADPGFRKYITGEVWFLGELDRDRLINIDRSSFNRECADYKALQRYLSRAIGDFKSANVQRVQRKKVEVRRLLEDRARTIAGLERIVALAGDLAVDDSTRGLPSSEPSRRLPKSRALKDELALAGATLRVDADCPDHKYSLSLERSGKRVRVVAGPALAEPRVSIGRVSYAVEYSPGAATDPPVVIRNRPRRIILNVGRPAHLDRDGPLKLQLSLALELAYLLGSDGSDAGVGVYERMLAFMEATQA